jgi:hypothetical protein
MIHTVDKLKSDIGDCISRNGWEYTDEIRVKVQSLIDEVKIDLNRNICTDDDIAFRKALCEKTYGRFNSWFSAYRERQRAINNVTRYMDTASRMIHNLTNFSMGGFDEQKHFENQLRVAEMLQREEMQND